MAASPDYDRVASVLVAIALRLTECQDEASEREGAGEEPRC
jgi:hypothetical protein